MLANSKLSFEGNCGAEIFPLASSEFLSRPHRLEAGFYASEGYRAVQAMERSGFPMASIDDLADVKWYGVQKRVFVKDPKYGIPYLDTSGMMEARPQPTLFLSKTQTKNLSFFIVQKGTILMSMSGTVGNVCLVDDRMDGWAVTVDALRIAPKDIGLLGIVYCYLQSPLGQFLTKRSQSGSVVTHIYEDDIKTLPIPHIPRNLKQELNRLVLEASRLRVQANQLLDKATVEASNLVSGERCLSKEDTGRMVFNFSLYRMQAIFREEGFNRMDSPYYEPDALQIREGIKKIGHWDYLCNLTEDIVLIPKTFVPGVFKVEPDYGIPYFTGKELFKSRLAALTFIISRKRRDMDRLIVSDGLALVTCAGTVGKVMYVRKQFTGSAVTHDAIRVIPGEQLSAGYIYAFLDSPLGQAQLRRCKYGSVIPRLHKRHIERIVVPIPPDKGEGIGAIVDSAFDLFSLASKAEENAINLFLDSVKSGRKETEARWAKEY